MSNLNAKKGFSSSIYNSGFLSAYFNYLFNLTDCLTYFGLKCSMNSSIVGFGSENP